MVTDRSEIFNYLNTQYCIQLGIGAVKSIGTRFHNVTALDGKKVTKVCCGGGYTVALCITGEVYTWGDSINSLSNTSKPVLVSELRGKRVCNIACGSLHTMAVVENAKGEPGDVYVWGIKHVFPWFSAHSSL
jgi:alpha-tubulin suppressor-like RCC1 family protein